MFTINIYDSVVNIHAAPKSAEEIEEDMSPPKSIEFEFDNLYDDDELAASTDAEDEEDEEEEDDEEDDEDEEEATADADDDDECCGCGICEEEAEEAAAEQAVQNDLDTLSAFKVNHIEPKHAIEVVSSIDNNEGIFEFKQTEGAFAGGFRFKPGSKALDMNRHMLFLTGVKLLNTEKTVDVNLELSTKLAQEIVDLLKRQLELDDNKKGAQ